MIHAFGTCIWHLPKAVARCTMKSKQEKHPQGDTPDNGVERQPGAAEQPIAGPLGLARAAATALCVTLAIT